MGRKQVLPCEAESDLAEHYLLMERKFFGLIVADVMCLACQLAVRNGIKIQFCKRNEKAGRKWLKHFLSHPKISVRTPEGLSFSRARGFTPESVAQFFEIYEPAMDTIQQSCKTLQLRRNRHHYCTAQTHENFMIERHASETFSSIHRTGITSDSRHLYESNWTLHSSVTCISKKKNETRSDEWHTAWINPRVPSLRVHKERDFFPMVSSFH